MMATLRKASLTLRYSQFGSERIEVVCVMNWFHIIFIHKCLLTDQGIVPPPKSILEDTYWTKFGQDRKEFVAFGRV